jgi:hypothetical protein
VLEGGQSADNAKSLALYRSVQKVGRVSTGQGMRATGSWLSQMEGYCWRVWPEWRQRDVRLAGVLAPALLELLSYKSQVNQRGQCAIAAHRQSHSRCVGPTGWTGPMLSPRPTQGIAGPMQLLLWVRWRQCSRRASA